MQLPPFLLLIYALLKAEAKEKHEGIGHFLRKPVMDTFELHGKRLRLWSVHGTETYVGIPHFRLEKLQEWRFFYEPILVPDLSTDNKTSVMLYPDPSLDYVDRHKVKLFLKTNSSEIHDLAFRTVKMALKNDSRIAKEHVKQLPIIKLNLTLSVMSKDLMTCSNKMCCFEKMFQNPGPTVELIITVSSEEKAKETVALLENIMISYNMDVDLATLTDSTDGKIILREYTPFRLIHVQEENLKSALEENFDLMKRQEEHQTEINELLEEAVKGKEEELTQALHVNEKMNVAMLEDQTQIKKQLQKADKLRVEELKYIVKENADLKKDFHTQVFKIHEKMLNLEELLTSISKRVCSPGWIHSCFLNSCYCYRVFSEKISWYDASKSCKQYGSELASIHSLEEDSFVGNLAYNSGRAWIGLNDHSREGSFQWTDRTPVDFFGWDSGQPNDRNPNEEDCILTKNTGRWHDNLCGDAQNSGNKFPYICKRKL